MTAQEAIHCMKFVTEEEVCEECPIYGETGTDHCFVDAHILAIKALKKDKEAYYNTLSLLSCTSDSDLKLAMGR